MFYAHELPNLKVYYTTMYSSLRYVRLLIIPFGRPLLIIISSLTYIIGKRPNVKKIKRFFIHNNLIYNNLTIRFIRTEKCSVFVK
jgi:hypothetical protein